MNTKTTELPRLVAPTRTAPRFVRIGQVSVLLADAERTIARLGARAPRLHFQAVEAWQNSPEGRAEAARQPMLQGSPEWLADARARDAAEMSAARAAFVDNGLRARAHAGCPKAAAQLRDAARILGKKKA